MAFTPITLEILQTRADFFKYLDDARLSPSKDGRGTFVGGNGIAPESFKEFGIVLPKGGMIIPNQNPETLENLIEEVVKIQKEQVKQVEQQKVATLQAVFEPIKGQTDVLNKLFNKTDFVSSRITDEGIVLRLGYYDYCTYPIKSNMTDAELTECQDYFRNNIDSVISTLTPTMTNLIEQLENTPIRASFHLSHTWELEVSIASRVNGDLIAAKPCTPDYVNDIIDLAKKSQDVAEKVSTLKDEIGEEVQFNITLKGVEIIEVEGSLAFYENNRYKDQGKSKPLNKRTLLHSDGPVVEQLASWRVARDRMKQQTNDFLNSCSAPQTSLNAIDVSGFSIMCADGTEIECPSDPDYLLNDKERGALYKKSYQHGARTSSMLAVEAEILDKGAEYKTWISSTVERGEKDYFRGQEAYDVIESAHDKWTGASDVNWSEDLRDFAAWQTQSRENIPAFKARVDAYKHKIAAENQAKEDARVQAHEEAERVRKEGVVARLQTLNGELAAVGLPEIIIRDDRFSISLIKERMRKSGKTYIPDYPLRDQDVDTVEPIIRDKIQAKTDELADRAHRKETLEPQGYVVDFTYTHTYGSYYSSDVLVISSDGTLIPPDVQDNEKNRSDLWASIPPDALVVSWNSQRGNGRSRKENTHEFIVHKLPHEADMTDAQRQALRDKISTIQGYESEYPSISLLPQAKDGQEIEYYGDELPPHVKGIVGWKHPDTGLNLSDEPEITAAPVAQGGQAASLDHLKALEAMFGKGDKGRGGQGRA